MVDAVGTAASVLSSVTVSGVIIGSGLGTDWYSLPTVSTAKTGAILEQTVAIGAKKAVITTVLKQVKRCWFIFFRRKTILDR
jgi:hypothetical protein